MTASTKKLLVGCCSLFLTQALRAQPPAGLAAAALARSDFTWIRDSVPGVRAYFLAQSWPASIRDSLLAQVPNAVGHARQLIQAPPVTQAIDVFFVESRSQMEALTGAGVTGFAHVAARAVFVVANPAWRAFTRHEVMHVVAGQAWGAIGGRSAWLQEGLGQAAEGECAGWPNESIAVGLARRRGWIPLSTLLGAFRTQNDLRAYLQAAAFTAFLLRHAGPAALRSMWGNEPTADSMVGSRSLADWHREWRASLDDRPVPANVLDAVESVGCGVFVTANGAERRRR